MNEEVLIPFERILQGKQSRFSPIRYLTPEKCAFNLDQFEYGNLRDTAMSWDAIERRDDVLSCVLPKRKKAVSRRSRKVVALDESPQAAEDKATLEYFYDHLTVTNAVDRNVNGGFSTLVRQMMDGVMKRYAVHHIVWQPSPAGLTAELFFVPLWYFENRTGQLRFLQQDFDVEGTPLNRAEWMITCGDGIMEALLVCYVIKHLPMKDWLIYSQRHGSPGVQGKTSAARGSEQWNNVRAAVRDFANGFSCVTGLTDQIEKIDISASGELPFPKLIELMNRSMAAIVRGADLSSMSGHGGSHGGGQGASLQGEESDILEFDDCELISETLNKQIDKWVIFYKRGSLHPLAKVVIEKPAQKDTETDLKVDAVLFTTNLPQTVGDVAERYDRALPEGNDGTELIQVTTPPPKPAGDEVEPGLNPAAAANARVVPQAKAQKAFLSTVKAHIDQANVVAWKPMTDRINALLDSADDQFLANARQLQADAPELLKPTGLDEIAVKAWQDSFAATVINGLTQKGDAP